MTARPSILRGALRLYSPRLVLGQIELAGLLFVLFVVWLRVPDASALDIAATILLGLLIVAIAGGVESFVLLRLCGRERTLRRLLLGTLLLAAAVALWFGWSALIDGLRGNDFERASYWNSRLPHQLRYFFTYQRVYQWLGWLWSMLIWMVAALFALAVICILCSAKPLRAVVAAIRSLSFWVVLLAGSFTVSLVTSSLIGWTPGHGLRGEMFSLILRLGAAVIFDALVLCLFLAVAAACCRSAAEDAEDEDIARPQSTPTGTPDRSQPRTAGNP